MKRRMEVQGVFNVFGKFDKRIPGQGADSDTEKHARWPFLLT